MIEVFLRSMPLTPVRQKIADAVVERWKLDSDVKLTFCPILYGREENFHWSSRIFAETTATNPFYILADDDHLILGENWAKRAAEQLQAKPDYALLSGRSVIVGEFADIQGLFYGTGCPCVLRKGAIDYHQLVGPANLQDGIIGEALRRKDWKAGYGEGLDYIHAGYGLSQVEPKLWLRY